MPQPIIDNPILNSPFSEPARHFRFDEQGITNEVVESRGVQENKRVNRIRQRVAAWRAGGHVGVTVTTARLLEYWNNPEREKKLFFRQIEAVETAIYMTEVAKLRVLVFQVVLAPP